MVSPSDLTNFQFCHDLLTNTNLGKIKLSSEATSRKPTDDLTGSEKARLKGHYVRVRYNDEPVVIPGCKLPGKHLEGDESFCTLVRGPLEVVDYGADSAQEAFKAIVDRFTPSNWKEACMSNLDTPAMPPQIEPAGY